MKRIEYKLIHTITDQVVEGRFQCFNEVLSYYRNLDSSRETYDKDSNHLLFMVDGQLAGYTRLTECPNNYMSLEKTETVGLSDDSSTLEMGRTFVLPEYRDFKLLNVILGVGLNLCRQMGYSKVVGNVSYEAHIKMPATVGFEYTEIISSFKMPFSDKGKHNFYLLECDLEKSHEMRQKELARLQGLMRERGYELELK